jgi:hypothetical protein
MFINKIIRLDIKKGLEQKIKKAKPKDMFLREWYGAIMQAGYDALKKK